MFFAIRRHLEETGSIYYSQMKKPRQFLPRKSVFVGQSDKDLWIVFSFSYRLFFLQIHEQQKCISELDLISSSRHVRTTHMIFLISFMRTGVTISSKIQRFLHSKEREQRISLVGWGHKNKFWICFALCKTSGVSVSRQKISTAFPFTLLAVWSLLLLLELIYRVSKLSPDVNTLTHVFRSR